MVYFDGKEHLIENNAMEGEDASPSKWSGSAEYKDFWRAWTLGHLKRKSLSESDWKSAWWKYSNEEDTQTDTQTETEIERDTNTPQMRQSMVVKTDLV